MMISIQFMHGGVLVIRDGEHVYKGGTLEKKKFYEKDRLGRLELLWAINALGYDLCGPLYYKEAGQFKEIENDMGLMGYLSSLGDEEDAVIYVDSHCHNPELWKRVAIGEREAHAARATINLISNMVVKRIPQAESETATGTELKIPIKESESEAETEQEETEDEDYLDGLDDEEGSGGEAEAEYRAVRESRTKKRLESLRRNKASFCEPAIKLCPLGIDRGLEEYIMEGNRYAGLLAGDEEYIGSSDVDSFASDSEEDGEEHVRSKRSKTRVYYDPQCEEPLWELGMLFKSVEEFREALYYYAVTKGCILHLVQNEPKRVRARCAYKDKNTGAECPWLLFASIEKRSQDFKIKTYLPVHHCVRQHENHLCNAEFIAKHLGSEIRKNPGITLYQMQELLKDMFEIYKAKNVCRRAKNRVLQEMVGDHNEEFRRLLDYRDCVLQTNPGSTCVVEYEVKEVPSKYIFESIYVCLGAVKEGFRKGCRKLIGLDGCFLKGSFKGQLLSATAKNGNDQIFPLAWAVVHNENTKTWSWFVELLRNDLNLQNGRGITIVTDMQKGLDNAIQTVLPECEHRECARHILANWSKKYPGTEKRKQFWRCAKSSFEALFKENLKELKKLGGPNIVEDLLRYNKKRWCRVYFNYTTSCDAVDNNVSETFNSWIVRARHKSIVSMLEEIRVQVMERYAKMIAFKDTWITDISPMAYDIIRKNTTRAMSCPIIWNSDDDFQVADGEWKHVVSIKQRNCTCRSWALKGIPCAHGIAALHHKGLNPLDFVAHWYHKDTYIQAYTDFIQPMPNLAMIPEGANRPIEPPPLKPLPGRPKKNRKKPADELKKFGKASRCGSEIRCSYCKKKNHNIRKCEKKKSDEAANKSGGESVVGSKTKSSSSKNARASSSKPSNAKKRKLETAKFKSSTGYGVLVNDKTGATVFQTGNAANNVVIRPPTSHLKSSTVVTGDIGFTPTTRKWKGKQVMTQDDLMQTRTKKQSDTTATARLHKESLSQKLPPTEAQKKRAAENKARAERLLAATTARPARVTRSKNSFQSSSQPNPTPVWKI